MTNQLGFGTSGAHEGDESVEDVTWIHERTDSPLLVDVLPPELTNALEELDSDAEPEPAIDYSQKLPLTDEQEQDLDPEQKFGQREKFTVYVSEQPSERIGTELISVTDINTPLKIVERVNGRKSVLIVNRTDALVAGSVVCFVGQVNGPAFPLAPGAGIKFMTKTAIYALLPASLAGSTAFLAIAEEMEE